MLSAEHIISLKGKVVAENVHTLEQSHFTVILDTKRKTFCVQKEKNT